MDPLRFPTTNGPENYALIYNLGVTLQAGSRLGTYEIIELLGKGGMGEVYSARDLTLLRKVAIKILPEAVANDPDRRLRFEREARILASLNHPNIAAIYGLEMSGQVHFLVMELVAGKTLAERLQSGPISPAVALPIFRQIAEGLEAAHENGVIHRDLKPANVKITPDDKVKILDFGLAKAFKTESDSITEDSISQTASLNATETGLILGTAPYMSPEHLRGKVADRRTDIWAFGCVLFEALSGKMTFRSETFSDTISAILNAEPDWQKLPPSTPAFLQRLLRQCLQKDPRNRLQSIGDARVEIEDVLRNPDSVLTVPMHVPTTPRKRVIPWIAIAVFAPLIALAGWFLVRSDPSSEVSQDVRYLRLTDFPGLEDSPAIAPDGKSVAFSTDSKGKRQIFIRLLSGGTPLQITNDDADHLYPRWSPDSTSVLYFSPSESNSEGTIWEISALGGSPRKIASSIGGVDLSHDGKEIAFFRFHDGQVELAVASRNGSNPRTLTQLDPALTYSYPRWSPDDQSIGYQQGIIFDWSIRIVSIKGGKSRTLLSDGSTLNGYQWLPDGNGVVYSSSRGSTILYLPTFNLWTVDLNGKTIRQLTFGETSYLHPDMNSTGTLVASRMKMNFDIWKYPVDESPIENVQKGIQITHQTGQVQTPSISPDDREMVYLSDSGGHGNLWVMNLENGNTRQITFEHDPGTSVGVPIWSPDGKNIAFVLRIPGGWVVDLWLVSPDGSNLRKAVDRSGWAAWSGDGRWIYYGSSKQGIWELSKMSVGDNQSVLVRPENLQAPAVAPDGSALYFTRYLANVYGAADLKIEVANPENAKPRTLLRIPGDRIPAWQLIHPVISPDGKWLAMPLTDGSITNIWTLPTDGGQLRQITDFQSRRTFIARRVSWSSDGKSIYAAVGEGDADVILLSGLTKEESR